ncbi:CMRF35-like molecule 1 [Polypterus senegalus]|uniref:CMRF35-like molecule 1 n=1 Tax=Polypterus senegalus TaxID=55291 RepID=UPI001962F5A6|nr:CMRF35-like molecule 1 [Polypterus senegalus]
MLLLVLFLSSISAGYSVTTQSRMSATEGMTLNILCQYDKQRYRRHVKYWCKGSHRNTCTITKRSDDPQNGDPAVLIHDDKQGLFRVVLSNLKSEDTNWYWCGIEIVPGTDDMASVFLTVTAVPTMRPTSASTTLLYDTTSTPHLTTTSTVAFTTVELSTFATQEADTTMQRQKTSNNLTKRFTDGRFRKAKAHLYAEPTPESLFSRR